MLKIFGIITWSGCLIVLGYQSVYWMIYASWPSVTLLNAAQKVGVNLVSMIRLLPLEIAAKTAYICFTTELSIFLWWVGVSLFSLILVSNILLKK